MKNTQVFQIKEIANKLNVQLSQPFNGELGLKYVIDGIVYDADCFVYLDDSFADITISFAVPKERVWKSNSGKFFTEAICIL